MMSHTSYRSIYTQIYSRRLLTPCICEVDARSAGNPILPERQCFTIASSHALSRWLRAIHTGSGKHGQQFVLELGCGFGGLSRWIADRTKYRVIAIDGCSMAIKMARKINAHPNVEFVNADFSFLPEARRWIRCGSVT